MAVQNTGDAGVFFDEQIDSTASDDLISAQVDPSQPQVKGLSTTTDPLVADRHVSARMGAFDSDQFDLSESSVLMRLLTALLAGAGIGGVRRQQIIARMSVALAGTNFIELDGFWGSLFSLTRSPEEAFPTGEDGVPLDPSSDVADAVTWDTAQARDGRYRSRIEQLAKGFALGATYDGLRMAARAVINADVEIVESWTLADYATDGAAGFLPNTWQMINLQYGTWGNMQGVTWGVLALGNSGGTSTDTPLGNRGEVSVIPSRGITEAERYQLHLVLSKLAPAGTMISIADTAFAVEQEVEIRSVGSDSVDWDVVSVVGAHQALDTASVDLYPGSTGYESGRPALSRYTGESWSYNGHVGVIDAYVEDADGISQPLLDYQTVTFADGTSHDYLPTDALIDSRRLALAKAAAEGVATVFPYAEGRFSA